VQSQELVVCFAGFESLGPYGTSIIMHDNVLKFSQRTTLSLLDCFLVGIFKVVTYRIGSEQELLDNEIEYVTVTVEAPLDHVVPISVSR
jgi:hypothetical protein